MSPSYIKTLFNSLGWLCETVPKEFNRIVSLQSTFNPSRRNSILKDFIIANILSLICLWPHKKICSALSSFADHWKPNFSTSKLPFFHKKEQKEYIWKFTFCKPILHWLNQSQHLHHSTRQHLCLSHCLWIRVQWEMQVVLCLGWIRVFRILFVCLAFHLCLSFRSPLQVLHSSQWLSSWHMLKLSEQKPHNQFIHLSSYEAQCRCHHQQPSCWYIWFYHQDSVILARPESHGWLFRITFWKSVMQPFSPTYIQYCLCFSDQLHHSLCIVTEPIFSSLFSPNFWLHCVSMKWRLCSYIESKKII